MPFRRRPRWFNLEPSAWRREARRGEARRSAALLARLLPQLPLVEGLLGVEAALHPPAPARWWRRGRADEGEQAAQHDPVVRRERRELRRRDLVDIAEKDVEPAAAGVREPHAAAAAVVWVTRPRDPALGFEPLEDHRECGGPHARAVRERGRRRIRRAAQLEQDGHRDVGQPEGGEEPGARGQRDARGAPEGEAELDRLAMLAVVAVRELAGRRQPARPRAARRRDVVHGPEPGGRAETREWRSGRHPRNAPKPAIFRGYGSRSRNESGDP